MENVGTRIRALRNRLKLSQTKFAEYVGVQQATVSRWETGEDDPTDENLATIADKFDADVALLRYGYTAKTNVRVTVPLVGYIGAGEAVSLVDDHAIGHGLEMVELPPGLSGQGIVALRIKGDSMRPLRPGWLVYYTRDQDGVPAECVNEVCVVKLVSGELLIKELRRGYTPDRYNLISWTAGVDMLEDQAVEWAAPVLGIRRP